jgi:hypothetical protein
MSTADALVRHYSNSLICLLRRPVIRQITAPHDAFGIGGAVRAVMCCAQQVITP